MVVRMVQALEPGQSAQLDGADARSGPYVARSGTRWLLTASPDAAAATHAGALSECAAGMPRSQSAGHRAANV